MDPPDSEFDCSICREVLHEPNLTSCCGNHLCQACIEPLICARRPCPKCGSEAFTTILDKSVRRKIFALDVRCPVWRRGCRWTGELGNLAVHLDGENGDCEYVDVKCTRKCGVRVQRRELPGHLEQFCPKRQYMCDYCPFKATYEVVNTQHLPLCENFPLPCPNECGVGVVKRCQFEQHQNECPLEVIDCDFSFAGCASRMKRKDKEVHMEESTQNHLMMVVTFTAKLSQENQQQLVEVQEKFQSRKDVRQEALIQELSRSLKDVQVHHSRQMAEIQEILKRKEQQTQKELEKRDEQIAQLQQQKEMLEREIQQLSKSFQEKNKQFQASLDQMSQELSKNFKDPVQGTREQGKQIAQIREHITQLETTFAEKTRENDVLKQRLGSLEIGGVRRLEPPTVDEVLDNFTRFKQGRVRREFIFSTQRGREMKITMTAQADGYKKSKTVTVHVDVCFTHRSYDPSDEKTRVTVQLTDPTGREPPCSKTKYGAYITWSNFIPIVEMEKYVRNNMVHFSVSVKEAD